MNESRGPSIEYFQPPGPYVPRNSWRRRSDTWVWVVSVLAGVLLAAAAVTALIVGMRNNDAAAPDRESGAATVYPSVVTSGVGPPGR